MNKLIAILLTLPTWAAPSAFAQNYNEDSTICSPDSTKLSTGKCAGVGTGVTIAAGSGIYAAAKYSKANSIETEFTQQVYSGTRASGGDPVKVTSSFTEGDKITIGYQLSEAENRAYHINQMESGARSARVQQGIHVGLAATATKARYESRTTTDANGQSQTTMEYVGEEPDWAMRAVYAAQAISDGQRAKEYDAKAADARNGGAVPTYDFNEVLDSPTGTANAARDYIKARLAKDGVITSVKRLPVEKFAEVKKLGAHAIGGLVGVGLGLGLAAEEGFVGYIGDGMQKVITNANSGDSGAYSPSIKNYDDLEKTYGNANSGQ